MNLVVLAVFSPLSFKRRNFQHFPEKWKMLEFYTKLGMSQI